MTRRLNTFVYEATVAAELKAPDLPVYMEEHFSQCGEDIIIVSLIRAWCLRHNIKASTLQYCEIGGNHPIATSATYLLNKTLNMSGVIVEANPYLIDDIKRIRINDRIIHAAITDQDHEFAYLAIANTTELSSLDKNFVSNWPGTGGGIKEEIKVPALRINELFHREFKNTSPIYLSIDVESLDLPILKDLDFTKFRPLIIQTEPSDHFIENNTKHINVYMEKQDYILISCTNVNMIFLDSHSLLKTNNTNSELDLWVDALLESQLRQFEEEKSSLLEEKLNLEEKLHLAEKKAQQAKSDMALIRGKLEEIQILYPDQFPLDIQKLIEKSNP